MPPVGAAGKAAAAADGSRRDPLRCGPRQCICRGGEQRGVEVEETRSREEGRKGRERIEQRVCNPSDLMGGGQSVWHGLVLQGRGAEGCMA